ncbi:unnamed protein product [Strongylus vulgaris]|uniref:Uncharacterized protein n=1 Tax=Strongylus vulgaris TaxID=40348 RepID=A0A3P7JGG7_STRVU|nr:unnamed protein product [Strongylus vulgaris]
MITTATYSRISCLIQGTAWENLHIVAGTWAGELIICRPCSHEEAFYDLKHTLLSWRLSGTDLHLEYKQVLRVGCVRAIVVNCKSVCIASDYGSLVRVYKEDLQNEAILSWEPLSAVKAFTRLSTGGFQLLQYKTRSNARFMSRTSINSHRSEFVAVVEDKKLRIFKNKQEVRCDTLKRKLIAVHIQGPFAFLYREDDVGKILNLELPSCLCVLNFGPVIKSMSLRSKLKITSFAVDCFGERFSVAVEPNGKVALLSARQLCPYLPDLVPAAMSSDNRLILAFSGRLVTAHMELKYESVLIDALHRANIVDVSLMHEDSNRAIIATAAEDHSIVIFSLDSETNGRTDKITVYNEAKPTCLCSHPFIRSEWLLYVGGEKGSVASWLVTSRDLRVSDPKYIVSSVYRRDRYSARCECEVHPNHYVVIAYADGILDIVQSSLIEDQPGFALQLLKRIDSATELSVPSQVFLRIGLNGQLEISLATTSGRHGFHYFVPRQWYLHTGGSDCIEECGLSAIFVYPVEESGEKIVAFGSESGCITLAVSSWSKTTITASAKFHSGTVSALQGSRVQGVYCLVSVSLDCRLAVWRISDDAKEAGSTSLPQLHAYALLEF